MKKKNKKMNKSHAAPATQAAVPVSEQVEPSRDDALEALRKELADARDALLRARAEAQNIVKRSANERAEAVRFANGSLIKSLLGTVDDFQRTLEHTDAADVAAVVKGVQLIYDNFMKVLRDHRVELIDALDKAFDPHFHEAMQQQPVDGKQPGTVIAVLETGYRLDDRVLRPAKVVIVAAAEPAAAAAPADVAESGDAARADEAD